MADDDEEKRTAMLERWRIRLESGEPIMTFSIDEPLRVEVTPEGGAVLKFVYGQIGNFETAALALAVLSPGAARKLKAIFLAAGNIPDTPLPERDPRSRN